MGSVDLDRPETYRQLDPDDMYRRVNELPEQIEAAWALARDVELPEAYRSARSVVIGGMGGSAIGGSLLEAYAASRIPIPLSVWRNYGAPGSVAANTLFIAASYSGNTEETLSALKAAHERGAHILAVTTGGEVLRLVREWGAPAVTFSYEAQPRATLGYLFTPLVCLAEKLGLVDSQEAALTEAVAVTRAVRQQWGADVPERENQAKQLARALSGRAVVMYGGDYLGAVARRWKTQLNENAKTWAFYEEFPELNHNAIVGYERPADLTRHVAVVVLNGSDLPHRIGVRMRVTAELMERFGVPYYQLQAEGEGRLAQMFSLISMGDYASYYLALLNDVDPTTIAPINILKDALARA